MADRLRFVTELGRISSDLRRRGDDRAADVLLEIASHLMDVHTDLCGLEERRERDRRRKRGRRASAASADSADFQGLRGIREPPPVFSPAPPFSNPPTTTQHTARAREAESGEGLEGPDGPEADVVNGPLTPLLRDRIGERDWPDVEAFLRRRRVETRAGWTREMLTLLTSGPWAVEDLAHVCRDDRALDRPIGTPKGLRAFLGSAREERLALAAGAPIGTSMGRTASTRNPRRSVQEGPRSKPTEDVKELKWQR